MSHAHTPWNWVLLFECALDLVSDNKEVNVGTKFNLSENFWPDMVSSHKFNLVKNKIKNKKIEIDIKPLSCKSVSHSV